MHSETSRRGGTEEHYFPRDQFSGEDSVLLTFGTFEGDSTSSHENVKEEQGKVEKQSSPLGEIVASVDPAKGDSQSLSPGFDLGRSQRTASTEEAETRPSSQVVQRASPSRPVTKEGPHNTPQFKLTPHNIPKDMQRTSSAPPNPAEVGKLPPFVPDRFQHYIRSPYLYAGDASYGQPVASSLSIPVAYGTPAGQESPMFGQAVPQGAGYNLYGPSQPNAFVNQHNYGAYSPNNQSFDPSQRQSTVPVNRSGVVVPPKREKKRIPIIDPNTKQEIDLSAEALEKEKKRTSAASSPQNTSRDPAKADSTATTSQDVSKDSSLQTSKLDADTFVLKEEQSDKLKSSTHADETTTAEEKNGSVTDTEVASKGAMKGTEKVSGIQEKESDAVLSHSMDKNTRIESVSSLRSDISETSTEHVQNDNTLSKTEAEERQVSLFETEKEADTCTSEKEVPAPIKGEECMSSCTNVELNEAFSQQKEETSDQATSPRRMRHAVRGGKAITNRGPIHRDLESNVSDQNILNEKVDEGIVDEEVFENSVVVKTRFQYTPEFLKDLEPAGSLVSFDEKTQDDIQRLTGLSSKGSQSKKQGGFDKLSKNIFPGSNMSGPPPGFGAKSIYSKDSYDLGRARNRSVPAPSSTSASAKGRSYTGKELSDLRGTKVAAPDMRIIQAAQTWKHRRENEDEFTKKIYTVRSILNKLTYEKFDRLYEQILDVKIDSPDLLEGIVSEIFDKALLEPNFGPMYAELCSRLSVSMQRMLDDSADGGFRDESGKKVTFKGILLKKCQTEFERFAKCESSSKKSETISKEEGASAETSEKSDSLVGAEEEEERLKMKRRMIGNIKFIGELFKKDMISQRVIKEDCIPRLFSLSLVSNPEEDDLESLCKLLTSVGAKLDSNPENRSMLDQCFQTLDKFRLAVKLPSRIRFMILDLLDLRKNNWVERRQEAQAKTIGEIHADAQKEERAKSQASRERMLSSRDRKSMSGASYAPRMTMHMGTSSPRNSGVSQRVEASWEKLGSKRPELREVELGTVRLGPSGGILSMAGGARGWKTDSASSDVRRTEAHNTAPDTRPKSILTHTPSAAMESSEGSNTNADIAQEEESEISGLNESKALSPEAFSRRLKSILDEYHSLKDSKEAVESLKEIPQANLEMFVYQFIQVALESRTAVRNDAVSLFTLAKDIITPEIVKSGFVSVIEMLDDLDIDDPHASDFVASLVGRAAALGMLSDPSQDSADFGLNFLQDNLTKVRDSTRRLKFVILIFKEFRSALRDIYQDDSLSRTFQAVKSSGLDLERLSSEWNSRDSLYSLLKRLDASYLCLGGVLRNMLSPSEEGSELESAEKLLQNLDGLDHEVKDSTDFFAPPPTHRCRWTLPPTGPPGRHKSLRRRSRP